MYKSQFETFISNGSVSAFKGGKRDLWEKKLFKGPNMSSLARRITSNNILTTYDIGRGSIDILRNADDWKDRGSVAEVLQEIKNLWHILVRFGKPLKR